MKNTSKKGSSGKIDIEDKKVMTGKFRLSYPHLFKPYAHKNSEPKYSLSMLFDADDDISDMEKAAHNAAVEKWGPDKDQWPSRKVKSKKTGKIINKCIVKMPFRDGDTEKPDHPEYEGKIFVGASCKKQPSICDAKLRPILEESQIKAGDYARAVLIAFAYEDSGNYGVSFALLQLQKLETGESLGGNKDASEVFEAVDSDEEDDEEFEDESEDEDEDEEDEDEDEAPSKTKSKKKKSYSY